MKKYADYIREVEIAELWRGRKHILWKLDPEVNVLSGTNGIGKSTILRRMASGVRSLDSNGEDGITIRVYPDDAELLRYDVITTPDVRSEFDENLEALQKRVENYEHGERWATFCDIVDEMFSATSKTIVRDAKRVELCQWDEPLHLHLLSSGEKQLLVILMTVMLEDGNSTTLFMDEPEVSLHMEWQQTLIEKIRRLNPKVQIILSTHSPAIIMNGWMDKVTEVTDITL
ncbi:MAG: AAA family ATPase [Bacteroidales bacterium]|nr:AAA family ATPase [Bacteroidales bacterium]